MKYFKLMYAQKGALQAFPFHLDVPVERGLAGRAVRMVVGAGAKEHLADVLGLLSEVSQAGHDHNPVLPERIVRGSMV